MRHQAILNSHPNVVGINDAGAIDENGNQVIIDEVSVVSEVARLQAEYDNNAYQRQRATAYPTIQEQLDMQYWDGVNGTTIWADTVASVKSENPKP